MADLFTATPEHVAVIMSFGFAAILLPIIGAIIIAFFKSRDPAAQLAKLREEVAKVEAVTQAKADKLAAAVGPTKATWIPDALTQIPRDWRTLGLVIATVVLVGIVAFVARQQIGILVYKACLITLAGVAGYWVDRVNFPDSRPHMFTDPEVRWRYEYRRALIVAAAMLTSGLGA